MDPIITCDQNKTATVGDKYVTISCSINHTGIEISRFGFDVNGVHIFAGKDMVEKNEVKLRVSNGMTEKY